MNNVIMTSTIRKNLTLEEFFALPEGDRPLELIDNQAVPKMSPKRFHASIQKILLRLIDDWCQEIGQVYPEWAITLQRNDKDWAPVPDITYISFNRLPLDVVEDSACPVAPELVIEIISPGQTFGELTEKATDYLIAGVDRVWLVDTQAKTFTIFYPNAIPQTFRGDQSIRDELLPGLEFSPQGIFQQARIPD
jgi:Uma2 family endonuclease